MGNRLQPGAEFPFCCSAFGGRGGRNNRYRCRQLRRKTENQNIIKKQMNKNKKNHACAHSEATAVAILRSSHRSPEKKEKKLAVTRWQAWQTSAHRGGFRPALSFQKSSLSRSLEHDRENLVRVWCWAVRKLVQPTTNRTKTASTSLPIPSKEEKKKKESVHGSPAHLSGQDSFEVFILVQFN